MSSTPFVSVIIPVFNRPKEMQVALRSVLAQTYKNYEIIIVDDGSNPKITLPTHFKNKKNIFVLHHPHNKGAAAARNTGMRAAKGKYIAFLDSDDEWFPHKLAVQITHLEKSPSHISGCVTGVSLKGTRTQITRHTPITNFRAQTLKGDHLSIGSTLIFRKDMLKKSGCQPEDLMRFEDWEWQISVSQHHQWSAIPKALVQVNRGTPPTFYAVKHSLNIMKKRVVLKTKDEKKLFYNRCLYELFLGALLDKKWGHACQLFSQLLWKHPAIIFQKVWAIIYRRCYGRKHLPNE